MRSWCRILAEPCLWAALASWALCSRLRKRRTWSCDAVTMARAQHPNTTRAATDDVIFSWNTTTIHWQTSYIQSKKKQTHKKIFYTSPHYDSKTCSHSSLCHSVSGKKSPSLDIKKLLVKLAILSKNTVLNHYKCMSNLQPYNYIKDNNNNRIQRRYSRFFAISSQRRELSPTGTLKWPGRNRVQITCNTLSAYHVQVSCYVPLGTKGQLSY